MRQTYNTRQRFVANNGYSSSFICRGFLMLFRSGDYSGVEREARIERVRHGVIFLLSTDAIETLHDRYARCIHGRNHGFPQDALRTEKNAKIR